MGCCGSKKKDQVEENPENTHVPTEDHEEEPAEEEQVEEAPEEGEEEE